MDYFKRESGIDFEMGENAEDFAFRVICDFPLKTLVTFTEGRYSRKQLAELLEQVIRSQKSETKAGADCCRERDGSTVIKHIVFTEEACKMPSLTVE